MGFNWCGFIGAATGFITLAIVVASVAFPWYTRRDTRVEVVIGEDSHVCHFATLRHWFEDIAVCSCSNSDDKNVYCSAWQHTSGDWRGDNCSSDSCKRYVIVYNLCFSLALVAAVLTLLLFIAMVARLFGRLHEKRGRHLTYGIWFFAFLSMLAAVLLFLMIMWANDDSVYQSRFSGSGTEFDILMFTVKGSFGPSIGWFLGIVAVILLLIDLIFLAVGHHHSHGSFARI